MKYRSTFLGLILFFSSFFWIACSDENWEVFEDKDMGIQIQYLDGFKLVVESEDPKYDTGKIKKLTFTGDVAGGIFSFNLIMTSEDYAYYSDKSHRDGSFNGPAFDLSQTQNELQAILEEQLLSVFKLEQTSVGPYKALSFIKIDPLRISPEEDVQFTNAILIPYDHKTYANILIYWTQGDIHWDDPEMKIEDKLDIWLNNESLVEKRDMFELILSTLEFIEATPGGEESNSDWLSFESAETDMRIQYPPELTVELASQEKAGFDIGRRRAYFFAGVVDGVDVDFSITATTEDFGIGIGEGCCSFYGASALDLSQSDEGIISDLESGYQHYKTDSGKFLEVYGLERIMIGPHEAVRFAKPAGFIIYSLSDHFLIPNPSGEYSNLLIFWRSADETFPSIVDESDVPLETLFSQIEDFAIPWMDELTESEKKEKEIIESILFTLEFVELEPEDVEDTSDMEFDLFKIPAQLEDLPFDVSMPFSTFLQENDSNYTIWFNYEEKGGLVFNKEPLTDSVEKVIPEGSTAYQSSSSGLVTYCNKTSCVIVLDASDEYYSLKIIDDGLTNFELELLKEYIKTIEVR